MNVLTKLKTGQFEVDSQTNQITFSDVRFYKNEKTGEFYPSVSTILDAYPKNPQFYEWLKKEGENADEIRDLAGESGSLVHKATEDYDKGLDVNLFNMNGTIEYRIKEWQMFERYVEFSEKYKPIVLSCEENFVSEKYKTAGTLDRVIELGGKRLLIDIKTSNMLHNHYFLQMAAYVKLYEEKYPEKPIDGCAILWLNAKTRGEDKKGGIQGKGWQLKFPEKDMEFYWNLFLCTQKLWMEENGDAKPRNLSYKLSHSKPFVEDVN